MNIYEQLIRELKRERNLLNLRIEVLEGWKNGTSKTGKVKEHHLTEQQKKHLSKRMSQVWEEKRKKSPSKKGYKYKGTHWTQLPENAERVRRHLRKIAREARKGL